jgi:glycolate oxidase
MLIDEISEELRAIVGENWVITDPRAIDPYLFDKTEPYIRPQPIKEVIVVKPGSIDEISKVMKLAFASSIPVFPRGGGTGLTGGAIPTRSGIVLSLERLNRVNIDKNNMIAEVEAGATLRKLIEEAEKNDLYFPPHPGDEGAQIGGLIACNAGGSRALRHGTMRNSVLGLQIVLPNGRLVTIGGKALKNNMGTNFSHLFIGSEGSLGIIVKAYVKLYPKPRFSATLLFPFSSPNDAIEAAMELLWNGYVPLSLELVDATSMRKTADYLGLPWKYGTGEVYLMILLAEPNQEMLYAEIEGISSILSRRISGEPILTERREEQDEILKIRSEIYSAYEKNLFEGLDVSLPLGEIRNFLEMLNRIGEKYGVKFPIVAHLGDGTFHPDILLDSKEKEVLVKVREEIYESAISLGGSITGEHGIGYTRRVYAEKYLDEGLKELMRNIKKAIDEKGIMNPDKFIP